MAWYLKKLNVRIDFIQIAIIDHVSFDLASKEKNVCQNHSFTF